MNLAKKLPRRFTFADHCRWPEEERWELIDGVAWDMSPAPSLDHQAISTRLVYLFHGHFRGGGCQVFATPVDVVLAPADAAPEEIDTVAQLDPLPEAVGGSGGVLRRRARSVTPTVGPLHHLW